MKIDIQNLDRRIIYLCVFCAVSVPILLKYTVMPARMKAAESFFEIVEELEVKPGQVAFVALDFGPNTKAENQAQAEVIIEHLFRRRIPVAVLTQYALAEGFLSTIPDDIAKRLSAETGESWEYGEDWVNLGYRPGSSLFIQALAKSTDIADYLGKDALGTRLKDLPVFSDVRTIRDIRLLAEFTGLVGVFDTYVRYFQNEGYVPTFGHGCTSITIPEAYIYLDSGQLNGLLEGIAGAAWYSELLRRSYPERAPDAALIINTALGIAHLVIILFIVFGNIVGLLAKGGSSS